MVRESGPLLCEFIVKQSQQRHGFYHIDFGLIIVYL
jgi:hypothetical protein